jgi:DNA-binding response OmpR family regulator
MGTIVIAEDDPDIRSLIVQKLSSEGHEVTATGDGVAALVAVRRVRPDAVVLDMQMPGLSGLDVVRQLRTDEATAHVPVIMVTSHDQAAYVGESFLSGADDFLSKPFQPRQLAERVNELLAAGRHTGDPAPKPVADPEPSGRPVGRRGFLGLPGRPRPR